MAKSIRLHLQKAIDELARWFQTWKIELNPDKSVAIYFKRSKGLLIAPRGGRPRRDPVSAGRQPVRRHIPRTLDVCSSVYITRTDRPTALTRLRPFPAVPRRAAALRRRRARPVAQCPIGAPKKGVINFESVKIDAYENDERDRFLY
ncbi:hypothetical protein EVAR_29507_1 [Eumeta japonica]|uniref:RNA-directed DNA polymerase from mobile element jockey n=1 Tax=Eumeta variegata TaxID=151549 RepID=A0A4C1WIE7_EUMVA|nr:hypothetical protein EVAR_29507_1 [Eumeta japonica]